MTGQIIDGLRVAADVKKRVKSAVSNLKEQGVNPCLATVLVGDDAASATYVKNKHYAAKEVGIITRDHRLSSNFSQNELLELIYLLNTDPQVHGILIQLPLPNNIDEFTIINALSPAKDVDGLTPFNAGMLLNSKALLKPCTPSGVIELLDYYGINIGGTDAIIINRSNLVGKPLTLLLLERDASVTVCHSKTKNLAEKLVKSDIVISAVGNRDRFTLTGDMIKPGSVIIDIGITRIKGKLAGDVDFQSVKEKSSWITPVPGGVGPMTVAMLLKNTVTSASMSKGVS